MVDRVFHLVNCMLEFVHQSQMQDEGAHEATQVDKVDAFISCELSAFLESYLSDDQTIEDHLYYETKYRILIDCGAKKSD